jgi:hypothetical protein
MKTFSGDYPIEHRAGEIERLRVQSKAMEPTRSPCGSRLDQWRVGLSGQRLRPGRRRMVLGVLGQTPWAAFSGRSALDSNVTWQRTGAGWGFNRVNGAIRGSDRRHTFSAG